MVRGDLRLQLDCSCGSFVAGSRYWIWYLALSGMGKVLIIRTVGTEGATSDADLMRAKLQR